MALDRRSTRWTNRGPAEERQAQGNRDRAAANRAQRDGQQDQAPASTNWDDMPLGMVTRAARAGSEDAKDALNIAYAFAQWGTSR